METASAPRQSICFNGCICYLSQCLPALLRHML